MHKGLEGVLFFPVTPFTESGEVDLPKLAARIEAVQARRAKPQGEAKKLYQQMEKIVGAFCPGLAKAPLHIHRYGASHHAH